MSNENITVLAGNDKADLVMKRILKAPREAVWMAWTEKASLAKWWGPKGYRMEIVKLDLHPGGIFHYQMETPTGEKMWGKFTFREIIAPKKIVFIDSFADKDAHPRPNPFMPGWPLEVINTLSLEARGGETLLTLSVRPINASPEEEVVFTANRGILEQGFAGTWEQLGNFLASQDKKK